MATLTISKKDYEAKPSFAFLKHADKQYGTFNEQTGKLENGLINILTGLVGGDVTFLPAFWDSALAHLAKGKPSLSEIETALEERIDQDEDTEPLLKEAYKVIQSSGFFKKQVREYWEAFEQAKDFGKTDEEKAENKMMYDRMMKSKAEIEA
ncbi:tail assembly chaperone [Rummeliibacillus pycnus]|uniref:tail assembly chaperone n=1 Tax=Rummeliibacillus pycnus TaxID=101070 RepID=UPI0037CB615A